MRRRPLDRCRLRLNFGATAPVHGRLYHFNRLLHGSSVARRYPDLSRVVLEPSAKVHLRPAQPFDVHDPLASLPHEAANQTPGHTDGGLGCVEAVLQIETHRFGRHQLFDELVSERHVSAVSGDDHYSMPCAHILDLNLRARRGLELGYDPTLGAEDGTLCQSQRESEACYHKKRAAGLLPQEGAAGPLRE